MVCNLFYCNFKLTYFTFIKKHVIVLLFVLTGKQRISLNRARWLRVTMGLTVFLQAFLPCVARVVSRLWCSVGRLTWPTQWWTYMPRGCLTLTFPLIINSLNWLNQTIHITKLIVPNACTLLISHRLAEKETNWCEFGNEDNLIININIKI